MGRSHADEAAEISNPWRCWILPGCPHRVLDHARTGLAAREKRTETASSFWCRGGGDIL